MVHAWVYMLHQHNDPGKHTLHVKGLSSKMPARCYFSVATFTCSILTCAVPTQHSIGIRHSGGLPTERVATQRSGQSSRELGSSSLSNCSPSHISRLHFCTRKTRSSHQSVSCDVTPSIRFCAGACAAFPQRCALVSVWSVRIACGGGAVADAAALLRAAAQWLMLRRLLRKNKIF